MRVRGGEGKCEGKCEGRRFALTLTLTTETPINRAFQTESEGVRVEKEKKIFLFFIRFSASLFLLFYSDS